MCWKRLINFLHMGEKIHFYAAHTLDYSLLNADVALNCPIQLYRTDLLEPEGEGSTALPYLGRSVNPISIRMADYAHHITTRPLSKFLDFPTVVTLSYVLYVM